MRARVVLAVTLAVTVLLVARVADQVVSGAGVHR